MSKINAKKERKKSAEGEEADLTTEDKDRITVMLLSFITIFIYFLLDNALEQYAVVKTEGFLRDMILSFTDLVYLIIFGLVIVEMIQPKIAKKNMYILITIFLMAYIIVRFLLF